MILSFMRYKDSIIFSNTKQFVFFFIFFFIAYPLDHNFQQSVQ